MAAGEHPRVCLSWACCPDLGPGRWRGRRHRRLCLDWGHICAGCYHGVAGSRSREHASGCGCRPPAWSGLHRLCKRCLPRLCKRRGCWGRRFGSSCRCPLDAAPPALGRESATIEASRSRAAPTPSTQTIGLGTIFSKPLEYFSFLLTYIRNCK